MQSKLVVVLAAAQAAAVALPSDSTGYVQGPNGVMWGPGEPHINARSNPVAPVCNADNCLRNLRDKRYSSSASAFCSTFIQPTVTNTEYTIATEHKTEVVTPLPVTITNVETVDKTVTTTDTTTIYTTLPDSRYKRAFTDNAAYPSWLSASYPVARVSSACGCFIATPSPAIQETTTLTTATDTITQTNYAPTPTDTVVQTATNTITVAAVETTTQGIICGIKACRKGTPLVGSFPNLPNVAACQAKCAATSTCKAFQYGTDTHLCNLGADDVNTWYQGFCATWKIYDRNCAF